MSHWIARDKPSGRVYLFDRRPVNDSGYFLYPHSFDSGLYLGMRPKLGFKLKRGECKRVKLSAMEVSK